MTSPPAEAERYDTLKDFDPLVQGAGTQKLDFSNGYSPGAHDQNGMEMAFSRKSDDAQQGSALLSPYNRSFPFESDHLHAELAPTTSCLAQDPGNGQHGFAGFSGANKLAGDTCAEMPYSPSVLPSLVPPPSFSGSGTDFRFQPEHVLSRPQEEAAPSTEGAPSAPCAPTEDTNGEGNNALQEFASIAVDRSPAKRSITYVGELDVPITGHALHSPPEIHVILKDFDQWQKLAVLEAEMIVTKAGR